MTKEIIQWDLSDLYQGTKDSKIDIDMKEILNLSEEFNKKIKGKVTKSETTNRQLKKWYQEYEEIIERTFYLRLYSGLAYSANSLDDEIKALRARIEEFEAKVRELTLFFEIEFNKLPKKRYKELLKGTEFKNYRNVIKTNRAQKEHQLGIKEEQIVLMKNLTGVQGFSKLYSEITSGFNYEFEIEGEKKSLTGSELFAYMYHKDPKVRYRALKTFVTKYRENELVFTHIYNNVLKDWSLECKKRKFKQPISRRNLAEEIDDEIVDILGEVTTKSNHIVERYYTLKKKILGLNQMKMSDLYAPVGEIDKKYTYNEAIDLIETVNESFHPTFKEIIHNLYEKKHIDVTPRIGKVGGAFCSYGKQQQYPFVFVNFTGDIESVLTLSHELGHAIHHYLIQQKQTMFNIGSSLAVAEIASVFNEILTFDYLMKQELSKQDKISLLCNHIEGNFATSHRQNSFYQFERRMHELIENRLPTTQDYKDIFTEEMEKMFGKAIIDIRSDYDIYCFVVSHFIDVPFYVYSYNMANLLVIALYQLYLEQEEDFKPKFIKLLSVGKSLSPSEMLEEIGINIKDPSFWEKGILYLTKQIDKLEKLTS